MGRDSIARDTNKSRRCCRNVGGSLPNDIFSEGLSLPTVWCRFYPGCSHHARMSISRRRSRAKRSADGGLYWDMGNPARRRRRIMARISLRLARLPKALVDSERILTTLRSRRVTRFRASTPAPTW